MQAGKLRHNLALQSYGAGPELMPSLLSANWTGTNGWSIIGSSTKVITKVADASPGTITPSAATAIVAGATYVLTVTVSAISGVITPSIGGVNGTALASGANSITITGITTGNLILTGTGASTATITAISVKQSADSYGTPIESWSTYATVWGSVSPSNGKEVYLAQQIGAQVSHVIRVRYNATINPKNRVLYGTRVFQINSALNTDERNIDQTLFCTELIA